METLFEELKRYVEWSDEDERALKALHAHGAPHFSRISETFYERILTHEGARAALVGGESRVGHLKVTLIAWMDRLLSGPWDEAYYEERAKIGRVHVRIALPQHYMFGAMNLVRREINDIIDEEYLNDADALRRARSAVGKILDLELAIMLHTYREDYIAQYQQNERLATFGQLVGSIGHELRNPLGVIESSLYILGGRMPPGDDRAKKHIDRIGEQLRVANGIISALLDMIRDKPLLREKVVLAELVAGVISSTTHPEGVRLVVEGFDDLPAVEGDATQLRQVIQNLVDNAVHACGEKGEVHIGARVDGRLVAFDVEDSGPGVDLQTLRRLFEPLVTTKAKGIGLGLALVKRIVTRHGGTVEYTQRPGHGARFIVRLPHA